MIYADANFFVYAAEGGDAIGEEAAAFLAKNTNDLCTSYLTIDEIMWIIRRKKSVDEALSFTNSLFSSGVNFLDVNHEVARTALQLMKELNLKPRDSFHAATMKTNGIKVLLSEDKDFDRLPGVKRIWFRK